jgi:hypothetical protein
MLRTAEVDRLLSFLPALERGEFDSADAHSRATGRYQPAIIELKDAILRSGLFLTPKAFRWQDWLGEARSYARAPSRIAGADLMTIRKLLATSWHQDRFVGGLLPTVVSSGLMRTLLERLKELRDEGGTDSVPRSDSSPAGALQETSESQ